MSVSESIDLPHFNDYWRVIRARFGIILTLFILTFGTGYFVSAFVLQKQYGGTVDIRVFKQDKDVQVFSQSDRNAFDPIFFESERSTIESKEILYPVIKKLNLVEKWSQRYLHGERLLREDEVYGILLGRHLKVEPQRGSNIIQITGISEEMEEAPLLANTIAETYIGVRTKNEKDRINRGLDNVADQIEKQRTIVTDAKKKVDDMRLQLGVDIIPGTQNESQLLDQELEGKQKQLDDARQDAVARRVRYEQLKNLSTEDLIDTLPSLGLNDANIDQIRQQELQGSANIQSLLKGGFGEEHPRVQSLRAAVGRAQEQLKSLAEGKRRALLIDLNVSEEKLKLLEADVASLRDKLRQEKSDKMAPFQEAVKERDRQQYILDQYEIRYKQENLDQQSPSQPATVISPANTNPNPVRPILWLNITLSGVAGLLLGLSVAFFIEYLDTSVKSLNDVEKTLGVPVLGIIPRGVKPLNKEPKDTPHAESYRILRARIDLQAHSGPGNTLTMISGGPGEGKSTTLFNLAHVCAEAGQSVIILDADLRRPSQHTILDIASGPGLADHLIRGVPIADLIRETAIPNLHIIPAGEDAHDAISRFDNQVLREIIVELKEKYQVIFIDSPPALGVSDASVIAHEVDKVVMVIQHRRYPREISIRTKKAIEEVQGNLVGVALNSVATNSDEGYYYYGAYADYYNNPKNRKKKKKGSSLQPRPAPPLPPGTTPPPTPPSQPDEF
ncbi:capsular exopolysaccharide family [Verrucomicrobium sp. GAS474]|uniref:GumC family protein n=1 Tax=Verrucomicrobium sp. GAS474 TaxID=1882831 RepID=UPI00087BE0B5|nr:tyrosine-protein kinase domain-containing protein [Verrucomicrobium sp. GAS474]SDU21831.1 capsular exopolysaccharide family [Verrucomicrobium sp. GAS474]